MEWEAVKKPKFVKINPIKYSNQVKSGEKMLRKWKAKEKKIENSKSSENTRGEWDDKTCSEMDESLPK